MLSNRWKKVVFAIAISLLYIPMVFLGINTFFPDLDRDNCYEIYPRSVCGPDGVGPGTLECDKLNQDYYVEQNECREDYEQQRKDYEGNKYIVLMIICLITSLVMLFKLDVSVIMGLFFGVVITAFSGTIRYIDSKSMIGFFLMVILFIVIIIFVQRSKKLLK